MSDPETKHEEKPSDEKPSDEQQRKLLDRIGASRIIRDTRVQYVICVGINKIEIGYTGTKELTRANFTFPAETEDIEVNCVLTDEAIELTKVTCYTKDDISLTIGTLCLWRPRESNTTKLVAFTALHGHARNYDSISWRPRTDVPTVAKIATDDEMKTTDGDAIYLDLGVWVADGVDECARNVDEAKKGEKIQPCSCKKCRYSYLLDTFPVAKFPTGQLDCNKIVKKEELKKQDLQKKNFVIKAGKDINSVFFKHVGQWKVSKYRHDIIVTSTQNVIPQEGDSGAMVICDGLTVGLLIGRSNSRIYITPIEKVVSYYGGLFVEPPKDYNDYVKKMTGLD